MKPRNLLSIALLGLLGFGIVVYASRIASYFHGTRLELGRVKLSQVDEATRERLRSLPENILATYYVSPRAEMPSELRRLESQVTDLLEAFRLASEGTFDYQILDPHTAVDPNAPPEDGQAQSTEEARYAAGQGIAPFRVRSVTKDAWSEKTIWSSLTVAYGAYPPAILNGLTAEHLPRLAGTILAHLDQMEVPRQPVIALSAPAGFDKLADELSQLGEVARIDFKSGSSIPRESDLLFWVAPSSVDREVLREVDRYLASGRSIVVAGSLNDVRSGASSLDGQFRPEIYEVRPSGFDAATLFGHFGLRATTGLVCDERSMTFTRGEGEEQVVTKLPFLLRCIAPNQRFGLVLRGQPNGTLLFEGPTTMSASPEELALRGWTAEVLAHTSDQTWVTTPPVGISDSNELSRELGTASTRQALMTLLRPAEPLRGSVVVMGSASPLRDDLLEAEGFAHRRLVDILVTNLASDERLVLNSTSVVRADELPELDSAARLKWRLLAVFSLPVLLGLLAVLRLRLRLRLRPSATSGGLRLALLTLGLMIAGSLFLRLVDGLALRADWTADGLNQLAPATEGLARELGQSGTVRAEVFLSSEAKLPPELRQSAKRLEALLADLERAGADLERTRVDPGELDEAERDELRAAGIEERRVTSREEGVTTVRTIYSALRLSREVDGVERSELVPLSDTSAFEALEFRVAFALWRLKTGRRPTIAFASDTPRLSPAEAHMDYQLKGFFAPVGEDAYSAARETLRDVGFEILHVNPREPQFDGEFDALVWLQPRRDATLMVDALARYLHRGGQSFVAAQHFNMQARQYRGTNFETVYWPQPQSPDLDVLWFPELGIDLARMILFDELKTSRQLETQVNRAAEERDYEEQASALPFLIRASAANFADDPIMRGVGDLAFIWGSYLEWDEARLGELGLEATPLISSSEKSWTYEWRGGYLPPETFAGFPEEDKLSLKARPRSTLAARFEGQFPLPVEPLIPVELRPEGSKDGLAEGPAAPGELVLVGNSEMFKNELLLGPEFRADHLLVNAVAELALPEELAAIATRRRVARGFDYLPGDEKARWRVLVISAGPVLLILLGLLRSVWRRRAPRISVRAEVS